MTRLVKSEFGLRLCKKHRQFGYTQQLVSFHIAIHNTSSDVRYKYLAWEGDYADELIGLKVEDEDLRRTDDHKVVDRRIDAAVEYPESVAPVGTHSVHGNQLRAIKVAFAGAMPVPRRIRLYIVNDCNEYQVLFFFHEKLGLCNGGFFASLKIIGEPAACRSIRLGY